jgi:predicted HD superfamily hydrolase involved in NAD metabolism
MADTVAGQIARLQAEMGSRPAGLIRHVERVIVEARPLAERWGADPDRAELAAWGHDLFRSHSEADQLRLALEAGLPVNDVERASPVFLHGPIAAVVMRERLGLADEEVLGAVRDHTTGLGDMPMLAKVLLLADKVERRKRGRDPALKRIRRLAHRNIDLALLCWSDWAMLRDRERAWRTHPRFWEARQSWVAQHHEGLLVPVIPPADGAPED